MKHIEPENDDGGAAPGAAPALRRAVRVLDYVSAAEERPTAADLARRLEIPKSTAHGLINAMTELGLLVRGVDGTFGLGSRPMRWTSGFLSQFDLVSVFNEYFTQNPELARYTITLSVLDGAEVVYLGGRNSDQPLGVTFRIGMRLPAFFTATGKALLATFEEDALSKLVEGDFPAPLTAHSVRDPMSLRRELAATRERGFSIENGQVREGMVCLGTVLYDYSGKAVAGIAVSLTHGEATPDAVANLGAQMREAAAVLSRRLGAA
jgi:IclR family transcriptional regulator, blcABC operon repressor